MFGINLGEFSLWYETYHTRILLIERYVRTLTYSTLAYAYPRGLIIGIFIDKRNCDMFLQYVDAVGLARGADMMPVKQKHDHHGKRILRIQNRGEGNGNN